ncbi:MAG TPA: hypothetical protein VFZ85_15430 [Jiangellaceae bacterium]
MANTAPGGMSIYRARPDGPWPTWSCSLNETPIWFGAVVVTLPSGGNQLNSERRPGQRRTE